jgi:hypothetical protein
MSTFIGLFNVILSTPTTFSEAYAFPAAHIDTVGILKILATICHGTDHVRR